MKEVWVLVKMVGVCHGQGDSGDEPVLAYRGWNTSDNHPVFASKKDAGIYISSLAAYGSGLIPVKLNLWNGNGKATAANKKQDKAKDASYFR